MDLRRHETILASCFVLHVRWPDPRQWLSEFIECGDENNLLTSINRTYATLCNVVALETSLSWLFVSYRTTIHRRSSKVPFDG
jgi:hypothetical protein